MNGEVSRACCTLRLYAARIQITGALICVSLLFWCLLFSSINVILTTVHSWGGRHRPLSDWISIQPQITPTNPLPTDKLPSYARTYPTSLQLFSKYATSLALSLLCNYSQQQQQLARQMSPITTTTTPTLPRKNKVKQLKRPVKMAPAQASMNFLLPPHPPPSKPPSTPT